MADEVAVTDEVAATDESRLLRRDLGDRRCAPPLNLGSRRGAARKQIDSPPVNTRCPNSVSYASARSQLKVVLL